MQHGNRESRDLARQRSQVGGRSQRVSAAHVTARRHVHDVAFNTTIAVDVDVLNDNARYWVKEHVAARGEADAQVDASPRDAHNFLFQGVLPRKLYGCRAHQ